MKRLFSIGCLLAVLTLPRSAAAQTMAAESESESEPLAMYVSLSRSDLEPEHVRRAVAQELHREVVLVPSERAALVITEGAPKTSAGSGLRLSYVGRPGQVVAREMVLPEDRAKALELIALLAGNLARDQTSDLIGALQDQRTAALVPSAGSSAEPARSDAQTASVTPSPDSSAAPRPAQAAPQAGAPPLRNPHANPKTAPPSPPRDYAPLNLSLWHPLSLDPKSHEKGYHLELGLAYSKIGALAGAGYTLGVLQIDGPTSGAAIATLWLRSRGPLRGVAVSSLITESHDVSYGAQFSGLVTLHTRGLLTGVQFAGLASIADDLTGIQAGGAYTQSQKLLGAQWAGAVAVTRAESIGVVAAGALSWTRSLQGVAISGALSISEDLDGVLVAGGGNVARDVRGLTLAGAFNVQRDVTGVAVASVNVQRHVRGLQIGVVNVAERVDGGALGVVNLAGNGRVSATAWANQDAALGGVRFISGMTYSELAIGHELASNRFVTDAGFGIHLPIGSRLTLSAGGAFSETRSSWDKDQDHADASARGTLGVRLTPAVELFAGAGVRYGVLGETEGDYRPEGRLGIAVF